MSSQKPGKTKQKSFLSWVKAQDTNYKARVEGESLALQKYKRGVLKTARIMLVLSLLKQLAPSYLY